MDDNIGNRITRIREEHEISQSAMARELGVSRSALYRYETGDRIPDLNFLVSFSKYFGLSLDSLVFEDTSEINKSENKKATPDEVESVLSQIWDDNNLENATEKQLELINKLIRAVMDTELD